MRTQKSLCVKHEGEERERERGEEDTCHMRTQKGTECQTVVV